MDLYAMRESAKTAARNAKSLDVADAWWRAHDSANAAIEADAELERVKVACRLAEYHALRDTARAVAAGVEAATLEAEREGSA